MPDTSSNTYTTIVTTDPDETAEINTARIGGTDYKFNYESLKNKPFWIKKTPGELILDEEIISFTDPNDTTQQEI